MIKPTKHLNLDNSLINVSAILINEFKKRPTISYDEILQLIHIKIGKQGKEIVPYALNFLFLFGKIEYHETLDVFEMTI